MLKRSLMQFVFFSLSAVFCLYSSEFTFIGLVEYQIKNPDYICGLFTALYVVSVANVVRYRPVDRYIAFIKGTYRRWIWGKEFALVAHTMEFTLIFILANLGVGCLKAIDMRMDGEVLHVVYHLFLFTIRFFLLGEILLFISILWKRTVIPYTVILGLSMGLDSRAIYIGDLGAFWPQYHMSSGSPLMSILYFISLILIFFYLNHCIYLQKDVF